MSVSKGKEIVKERGGILVPMKSREEIRLSAIYISPCNYISPLAIDTLKNAQEEKALYVHSISCPYSQERESRTGRKQIPPPTHTHILFLHRRQSIKAKDLYS